MPAALLRSLCRTKQKQAQRFMSFLNFLCCHLRTQSTRTKNNPETAAAGEHLDHSYQMGDVEFVVSSCHPNTKIEEEHFVLDLSPIRLRFEESESGGIRR